MLHLDVNLDTEVVLQDQRGRVKLTAEPPRCAMETGICGRIVCQGPESAASSAPRMIVVVSERKYGWARCMRVRVWTLDGSTGQL